MPKSADVVESLDVVGPQGADFVELLDTFRDAVAQIRGVPSWHSIVTAIGELYAEGKITARDDFAWEISPPVVARAVEVCSRGIVNDL